MNTRSKVLLAAAVAACCASSGAFAWGPTVVPDFTFYVAGGSAQGNAFSAFVQSLMTTSNLDTYTDDATCANGKLGSNYRAVFGTWKTTQGGIAAGTKVYVAYANNGGTFKNGIDALIRGKNVDYQTFLNNATNSGCGTIGGGTPSPFTAKATYRVTTAATTELHTPDVGLSDEEPALFVGPNLAAGASPITTSEASKASFSAIYENVFGVAVSSALAASLQATFGNVNISSAQVAAIFSGAYKNWNKICQYNTSTDTTACLPAGNIVLESRAAGSGSRAAWTQFFLNNPANSKFSNPPHTVSPVGAQGTCPSTGSTYAVCELSSNGAVQTALDTAGAATRAIGILGLEFQPVSGTNTYSFANLNGVDISGTTTKTCGNTFANAFQPDRVVQGDHALFYTNSLNLRSASVAGKPFNGDGSVNSDFMDAFTTAASDPVLEVSVPGTLLDPILVGAPAGNPYDECITKGTHNLDSTQPLQLKF
jgi:hypothetical protein